MRAAVKVLALGLLALTSVPARCQHDQHDEALTETYQAKPLCDHSPHIGVYSVPYYCTFYESYVDKEPNKLSVAYGTKVNVLCLGDAAKLTFSRNYKKTISDQSDYTFMFDHQFNEKLDLQSSQYIFKCTNIETTCERSVNISITPRLEVISPNVKTCFYCSLTYYVQYGNSVSVLCSGADATRLVMSKNGKTLSTKRKNGTTIESFEMIPDLQISEYACSDVDTTYSTSVNIKVVPNIYFQSQNETNMPYNAEVNCLNLGSYLQQIYYFQSSGSSIEIFCSGPRAVKFMYKEDNNIILSSENYNKTTIFTNITNSGISDYVTCADSKFSYYVQTVKIYVLNRMEVVSPSVRLVGMESGVPQYTILYGQSLEIVCSGADASQLTISDLWRDRDITNSVLQAVNKSAIKYIRNNPVWTGFERFICYHPERYESFREHSHIDVAVLPTVTNFRCVSYNMQFVNCTWMRTGPSNTANNTLYSVADGILTLICVLPRTSSLSKFCKWEYENDYRYAKALTFLIHSCSFVACYNQTFQFDHLSIVMLAPPEELTVLRTTSRGAVLRWRDAKLFFDYDILTGYDGDVDQIVQYWYPGIDRRNVNSSLVTCNFVDYCQIELNLPCPGQLYEVRIYHKLTITSEEELLSAPSSVTFYTDRESDNADNANNNDDDPMCNLEPIKTKEVMRYIVRERRKELLPEIQPLKRAVHALQEKLANIRKYIASIKEQNEK